MDSASIQASLSLAMELGGRLLFEQLDRAIRTSLDQLRGGDIEFTDEQLTSIKRTVVSNVMEQCFNPAYAETNVNRLTMRPQVVQVGYNQAEPLCYIPIQKIFNFHSK